MRKRLLKNIDWGILICIIFLLAIGLFAIFSADANTDEDEFKKQIMWILICIPVVVKFNIFGSRSVYNTNFRSYKLVQYRK